MLFIPAAQAQIKDWETPGGETCMVDGVPTLKCLEIVFNNILFISGGLVALALFIMFLIAGFTYITSFGNAEKVKKAQSTFRYAILGLVIYVSSYLMLRIIDVLFLGGQGIIFRFSIPGS
jgi:hypothetical protein